MKHLTLISILATLTVLTACGPREVTTITETVTKTVQAPSTPMTEIEEIVMDENDYRTSKGQTLLTKGLVCSLYNLTNGAVPTPPQPQPVNFPTSLPSATLTWGYLGNFNQESNAGNVGSLIVPSSARLLYTQYYAIRCTGSIIITDSGYHNFETQSDDASNLYIDNVLVVNNDGSHAIQTRSGSAALHSGVHTFRLDYMQGNGAMGLIVNMNGEVLPSSALYK